MARTTQESAEFDDKVAKLQEQLAEEMAHDVTQDPRNIDALTDYIEGQLKGLFEQQRAGTPPADPGVAAMVGLGDEAVDGFGNTRAPQGVEEYDEQISSERIYAVADLYYIYQHERIGVFRVIQTLKRLFDAGTLRLSGGPGAFGLYRFDRRQVLRYTSRERLAAYRRVFGYGQTGVPPGGVPNTEFHQLFSKFVNEVAGFWRDKRISDVIRDRAHDPSFGSIATVRRAALDLRNNLKFASYGHVNVLRIEVMQLLEESFRILNAPDVREQFGSEHAWDVIEEVLTRYLKAPLETSPRQRMAVTGRKMLKWVGQPFVLQSRRAPFETLLGSIAGDAEEWLTSAETLGLAARAARGAQVSEHDPRANGRRRLPAGTGQRRSTSRNRSPERELDTYV
jgi:hypothetical protein